MFLSRRKKQIELTRPEIDYANDLYRMFHNRELKPDELTKENVQQIIMEYSNRLQKRMQDLK